MKSRQLMTLFVLMVGCAENCVAQWVLKTHSLSSRRIVKVVDPGHFSESWAWLQELPGRVDGEGKAFSTSGLTDSDVIATGFDYHAFKHSGPGVGEVELGKRVEITGTARVDVGRSSALAAGSAMATHWFDGVPSELNAVLSRANRSTQAETIASFEVGPDTARVSIPIVWEYGAGVTTDDGGGVRTRTATKCPVSVFEYDLRCSGRIRVWAARRWNYLFQVAEAEASMQAQAEMVSLALLTHPRCP